MSLSSEGIQLISVAGRIYRSSANFDRLAHTPTSEPAQYRSFHGGEDEEEGIGRSTQYFVDQRGDDFFITLHIDAALVGFVIGAKGSTKGRLEAETSCKLSVSNKSREPASPAQVSIRASSHQATVRAADRVQLLLDSALSSPRLEHTHFVSIPLASAEVQARFVRLKEAILADDGARQAGIDGSLFADAQKLHLTLAMLKLYTEERRHRAAAILEGLRGTVTSLLSGSRLRLRLKGLQYMNDEPGAMSVLYVGVEEVGGGQTTLAALGNAVLKAYDAEGLLLPKDKRPFKPHVTLLSARLRHTAENGSGPPGLTHQQGGFAAFDGRPVLERFRDADFGELSIEALELSQRHTADAKTGYYNAAARLTM